MRAQRLGILMVVLCLLISACGPGPAPTVAPSEQTEAQPKPTAAREQPTSEPPAGQPDRIVYAFFGDASNLADHPLAAMVEEYNRAHPEVIVELRITAGVPWDLIGIWIAAGDLPDVLQTSAANILGYPAIVPFLVDVRPILDDETRADLGQALEGITLGDGTVAGFPTSANWGDWVCCNNKYLQQAGVDWRDIYAKGGWTWDEWVAASQKMTTDVNGKHPGDPGFDEKQVKVWAFGVWREYVCGIVFNAALNAGVPDANSAAIMPMWGNTFNWTGPQVLEVLRWWQDWHTKYKIATTAAFALGSDAEVYNMILRGEIASTWDFPNWCRTAIRDYNDLVEKGDIAGSKLDTDLVILPVPHHPNYKPANLNRSSIMSVCKQQPYKGDAHTQHVLEFVRWLGESERQATLANWGKSIPARASAQRMVTFLQEDENYAAHVAYAMEHAVPTFPFGHPVFDKWQTEVANPALEALAKGTITPEEAMDRMTNEADRIMDEWLKTADPALVKMWAQPPPSWPGPNFPDWKIRQR